MRTKVVKKHLKQPIDSSALKYLATDWDCKDFFCSRQCKRDFAAERLSQQEAYINEEPF